MPSRALQLAGNRSYNNVVAAFMCSGRSSIARQEEGNEDGTHLEVPRPAGLLGQEGFYSFCHTGAINYLRAKRNASSVSAEVKTGTWRPRFIPGAASPEALLWNLAPPRRGGHNGAATRLLRCRLYKAVAAKECQPPGGRR